MSPSVKLFVFHAAYSGLCAQARLSMDKKTCFPSAVRRKRIKSPSQLSTRRRSSS